MTQPHLQPSPEQEKPQRHEIERALDFALSGGSTGGETTHWSLKILSKAFLAMEREAADFAKERAELEEKIAALKLTNSIVAISNPDLEAQLSTLRSANAEQEAKLNASQMEVFRHGVAIKAGDKMVDDILSQLAGAKVKLEEASQTIAEYAKQSDDDDEAFRGMTRMKNEALASSLALAAALKQAREAVKAALPREGAWENTCPFCLVEVPVGELKHKPNCVVNLIAAPADLGMVEGSAEAHSFTDLHKVLEGIFDRWSPQYHESGIECPWLDHLEAALKAIKSDLGGQPNQ